MKKLLIAGVALGCLGLGACTDKETSAAEPAAKDAGKAAQDAGAAAQDAAGAAKDAADDAADDE